MNKWITIGLFLMVWNVAFAKPDRFLKRQQVTVTPAKLQLFVDQKTDPYTIKIAYTLNVPPDYIRSCARLIYQPYFMAAKHRCDLTPLIIRGKQNIREERRLRELSAKPADFPEAICLEANGEGMKIKLSQTVPFETWMTESKLRADVILESCDRKRHMEVLTLAEGVIWFPMGPGPVLVKYVKQLEEVPAVSSSFFLYPDGQVVYDRDYDGNARPEDWQGLKQLLLDDPAVLDKQHILQILDGAYSVQERRELLIKQPQYRYMQGHLFPLLRKVGCQFFYIQKKEVVKVIPL